MDFNIVTFHTAYNYGAVLQTYALQKFIADLDYSVGIYDYKPPYLSNTSFKQKLLGSVKSFHKKDHGVREKRFDDFRAKYLNLNLERDSKIFISGSDQVWNANGIMNPVFFLNFVGDKSFRASYAASIGASGIPSEKTDLFKEYINRFDAVSVREEDAKNCLAPLYDGNISVNVDPTLLHCADVWNSISKPVSGLPDNFILVYLLHIPKNAKQLIKWLKKESGYSVVLIDAGFASTVISSDIVLRDVGPEEFIWLMSKAQRVVTSSFHGTAFSVIFEKEFYSVVNPASPSRISNLLSKCGIKGVAESDTEFSQNIVDWDNVNSVLKDERQKSKEYIRDVFNRAQSNFRAPIVGTVEDLRDKCTGCSACEAVCPTKAITMSLNSEGFLEPVIDSDKCINCSKCKKECPLNAKIGENRKKAWYGWHKDKDVRFKSSSGGAFRALADDVLNAGGVVFGAVYTDNWRTVEISSTDEYEISELQKSKYTVSNPVGVYTRVKEELEKGRRVLFCSTPCQTAGLTAYLKKDYQNLLRCDFVCGGMASLDFYRKHLDLLEQRFNSKILSVDFRPKHKGWGKQQLRIQFENGKVYFMHNYGDSYFSCFAGAHASVRRTCLGCEFKALHVSDISLADFWGYKSAGIKKNKEGLSLIVANTNKGIEAVEKSENLYKELLDLKYTDYAFRSKSPVPSDVKRRDSFFATARKVGYESAAKPYYGNKLKHILTYIKVKLKI